MKGPNQLNLIKWKLTEKVKGTRKSQWILPQPADFLDIN